MLKLKNYEGNEVRFEGDIEELAQNNEYWYTESDLISMDAENKEYIENNHFEYDGKYCKYEFVEEV